MEGKLTKTGIDQYGNPTYAVVFRGFTFPVADVRDIAVRDIGDGEVTFITDRETGGAILGDPAPVRGYEVPNGRERK